MPASIKTYGEPGGVYLSYTLDFSKNEYVLTNEDGDVLVSDPSEAEIQSYAEAILIAEGAA